MVANEDVARELVQEATLHAYLSLRRLKHDDRFASWLCGIVLNLCRNYIRGRSRRDFPLDMSTRGDRFESVLFSRTDQNPETAAEEGELRHTVLAAVQELPEAQRKASLLFYYDQLSQREVAERLGISVNAVKARLHKARVRLRERLQPADAGRQSVARSEARFERRKQPMVKVTVFDVVEDRGDKADGEDWVARSVVILADEAGRRALPIWIGQAEGRAMAAALRELTVPRPLTLAFFSEVLDAAAVRIEEVRVERLEETTFYAVVTVRSGANAREVDARPSDAIALALHSGSPISVAEQVMADGGIDIPPGADLRAASGRGAGSIAEELVSGWRSHSEAGRISEERIESARKMLFETLFRADG